MSVVPIKQGGSFQRFADNDGNALSSINRDGTMTVQAINYADGSQQTTASLGSGVNPAFTGTFTSQQFNNVIIADQQIGADWGAKVQNADTILGATAGEIWISRNAGTSAIASNITLSANHTLRFIQGGSFNLGSRQIIVGAGVNKVAILGQPGYNTSIVYTGTDYPLVVGTSAGTLTDFFVLEDVNFILGNSAAGGLHLLNTLYCNLKRVEVTGVAAQSQYGILSDGTGNFSSYMTIESPAIFNCKFGIVFTGTGAGGNNANLIWGGAIIGPAGPVSGSIAINSLSGDSLNCLNTDIESYDIGMQITNSRNLVNCLRFEAATVNTHIVFASSATHNSVFCIDQSPLVVTDNGQANNVYTSDGAFSGMIKFGQFTVANLPSAGAVEGYQAYATNGRKVGEGGGAGTGVPVYYSNSKWRVYSTDAQVQA